MNKRSLSTFFSFLFLVTLLNACSTAGTNIYQDTAVGGLGGAAIGATTGAAIGSMIKHGTVGKSALLGTAIGAPVGMLAGVAYSSYSQNANIADNNQLIQQKQAEIVKAEKELESLRLEIQADSSNVQPDFDRRQHLYSGPSLGNRNR